MEATLCLWTDFYKGLLACLSSSVLGGHISQFAQMRETTRTVLLNVPFKIYFVFYYFPFHYFLCDLCSYTGYNTDALHPVFYFVFEIT